MRFTWDAAKSEGNARKHGVTFPEARSVFDDERAIVDRQSHAGEYRMQIVGYSTTARLLFVVFAEVTDDEIRIISARRATKGERCAYEEEG